MATSGLVVLPEESHQHALGTEMTDETQQGLKATEKGLACICSKKGHFRGECRPLVGQFTCTEDTGPRVKAGQTIWTLDLIPVLDIPDGLKHEHCMAKEASSAALPRWVPIASELSCPAVLGC